MVVKKVERKVGVKNAKVSRSTAKKVNSKLSLTLSTEKSVPSANLFQSITLIYGEKKIGKTELAAQFDKNMKHLMCEPMARELAIYQESCPTYEHVAAYIDLLVTTKHMFTSVSIDTLPLFYKMAMDYCGRCHGFEHPHDENDYGKSWGLVFKDFSKPLMKLLHSGLGVIFHAHESEEEVNTREGRTYTIKRPDGMKGVKEFIDSNIENVWYYHKRGNERFLQLRGDDYAFACTAFTNKFLTPTGEQVFAVPMGRSAKEGFKNLQNAFNNKQTKTYEEFTEKEVLKTRKVVKRKSVKQ